MAIALVPIEDFLGGLLLNLLMALVGERWILKYKGYCEFKVGIWVLRMGRQESGAVGVF